MTITKEEFFKPGKISAQGKASATDHAAKQIVTAEADQRARKTERLRQLREAQENARSLAPAAGKTKASKSARA